MSRCRTFHRGNIGLHNHETSACLAFDQAHAAVVIVVCMADQEDFGIAVIESELLNVRFDERYILREIRVDQDISFRGPDQVDGEIRGANVKEVTRNLEGGKWAVPLWVLRLHAAVQSEEE